MQLQFYQWQLNLGNFPVDISKSTFTHYFIPNTISKYLKIIIGLVIKGLGWVAVALVVKSDIRLFSQVSTMSSLSARELL